VLGQPPSSRCQQVPVGQILVGDVLTRDEVGDPLRFALRRQLDVWKPTGSSPVSPHPAPKQRSHTAGLLRKLTKSISTLHSPYRFTSGFARPTRRCAASAG
jgi:hypothetical protein